MPVERPVLDRMQTSAYLHDSEDMAPLLSSFPLIEHQEATFNLELFE